MHILAHENFPGEAVMALRRQGQDVAWVRVDAPGSSDQEVLERAQTENRVILTFDKDFGEMAFHWGLTSSTGVILFRTQVSPGLVARIAVAILESRADWAGHFSVIEEDRIRMTALPST
jgi:predicted nuclease of predicted toxin-antitoxin system